MVVCFEVFLFYRRLLFRRMHAENVFTEGTSDIKLDMKYLIGSMWLHPFSIHDIRQNDIPTISCIDPAKCKSKSPLSDLGDIIRETYWSTNDETLCSFLTPQLIIQIHYSVLNTAYSTLSGQKIQVIRLT